MNFKLGYGFLFMLSIGMLVNGCKEDCPTCQDPWNPDCENYDPCFGKDTVNTLFKVRRSYGGFPAPGDWCDLKSCDTFNSRTVHFSIPDGSLESSTYEWQIGSEADARTEKGFEVDFSDYLRDNGWERWIPITLSIRTPLQECLTDPNDTLVTVTRELFFTEKTIPWRPLGKYKGYFTNDPNNEVTIEFLDLSNWNIRKIDFSVGLTIGLPNIDTFMYPFGCPLDQCSNYKHRITRFTRTQICETPGGVNLAALSNNLLQTEVIKPDGTFNQIRHIWLFDKPNGVERFEFIGEKIK
jgi:hypothetical protein